MKLLKSDRWFAVFGAWLMFTIGASAADYPTTLLSQSPVGYWRLNERVQPPAPKALNAGSLGSSADGQYLLGAQRGETGAFPGITATSVRFTNPNHDAGYGGSKVEIPYASSLNPSSGFSVEFWAKPSTLVTDVFCTVASINSDPTIAVGTNANPRAGWLFYQNGSGTNATTNQWQFRLGNNRGYLDGDTIRGGIVQTGAWQHVVGTYDGTNATLYVNGLQVATKFLTNYQANTARPLRIGTTDFDGTLGDVGTFAGNRGFDGWIQEVAVYGSVLTPDTILTHFNTGQTNATKYSTTVQANQPLGYWRLGEPADPAAANLGTLGTAAAGHYIYSAHPGQSGPEPPSLAGFEENNRGCGFAGTNGYVELPRLNLNTNTVTITAWILATTTQTNNAGIVFCRGGTTVAGLKFDISDPNGLSYNWNDDKAASNFKSGLTVPVFQWCFVALIIQPDQATLCLQDGNQFSTAVNFAVHPDQKFDGSTLIGRDLLDPSLTFNGVIDEVAIFNRALTVGEVYSLYAAAAGAAKPAIFTDLVSTPDPIYAGATLNLTIVAGGAEPLSYQWRKDGTPIPGATSSTYSKVGVSLGDAGSYDVVITNADGTVTSQKSKVVVQSATVPEISQQPQGRTAYLGGSVSLVVVASGGALQYQWQKDGVNVGNATNSAYTIPILASRDSGTYRLVVSNGLGRTTSDAATVKVIVPAEGSYEEIIVGDNPESWWRLDEQDGSVSLTDAMGRHDGVYKGGVRFGTSGAVTNSSNTAVTFDGFSGFAEVPFSKALNTTNFTLECWVKANPVIAALSPVSSFTQPPGRGYLLHKSSDGLWYYMFGNGQDTAVLYIDGPDAIYNKWTHLAITYDGSIFSTYMNGQLEIQADPVVTPNNVAPFRIGFDQTGDGWNDYWSGDVDEVMYYQEALTPEQIATHYTAATYGTTAKPIFTEPLKSTTAAAGTFFFLAPPVEGVPPIDFQWWKDGQPIPGETNSFLLFTNLTLLDTGIYQLAATNPIGGTLSDLAQLAVIPDPSFANMTNDLVLHLTFDGNVRDTSGRNNNGQEEGSPRYIAGVIGSKAIHVNTAVVTNGPNDVVVTAANYVTLGTPKDLDFGTNANFSVSFWTRFTGYPGDLPFLCNAVNSFTNPGFTIAPAYNLGSWSWSLGDLASSSFVGIYGPDGDLNNGEWHHVVHTFDRKGSGLTYLDGVFVDSRSIVPVGDLDTGEIVTIGQDATGTYPEEADLEIDDLGVWRRVLSRFEVKMIFSVGKKGVSFDTYGPVSLAVVRGNDQGIQLVWQSGRLLEADALEGPWTLVSNATAPYYRVTVGTGKKFFRVQL